MANKNHGTDGENGTDAELERWFRLLKENFQKECGNPPTERIKQGVWEKLAEPSAPYHAHDVKAPDVEAPDAPGQDDLEAPHLKKTKRKKG